MTPDAKLVALHDKLMRELRILQQGLEDVEKQEGPKGEQGLQGPKGDQGERGRDGVDGKDGRDGVDGRDGLDGEDGISITNVTIDFDNHLRVDLSDGNTIDAGAIDVGDLEQGVTAIYQGGGNRYTVEAEYWIDGGIESVHMYTATLDGGDASSTPEEFDVINGQVVLL